MKRILALLACLAFVSAVSAATPPILDISQADLDAAIAAKSAVIIDVNGTDSYKSGHIPGAIDFNAHEKDLASVLPADKNALVVAYCGDIHCTAYRRAAYAAQDLGYTNVRHFAPGIKGWKDSGEKTEKAGN